MCTRGPNNKKTCREVYDYACRKGPLSPRLDFHPTPVKKPRKKHDSHRQFRAMKWANSNGNVNNSELFKPCKHKGECSKDNNDCDCMQRGSLCTKYCGCPEFCGNRFPGCRCAPGNCRTKQVFSSWIIYKKISSVNVILLAGSVIRICARHATVVSNRHK